MNDIRKVIAIAREQGYVLDTGRSTQMRPIAPTTWFQPNPGHVIRNEKEVNGDLPYAVYSLRGELLARCKRLGGARAMCHIDYDSFKEEEPPEEFPVNAYCYSANDLDLPNGTYKLHISKDDREKIREQESAYLRSGKIFVLPFTQVKDYRTDLYYEVRAKDCGAGCHCALEARRIDINEEVIGEAA